MPLRRSRPHAACADSQPADPARRQTRRETKNDFASACAAEIERFDRCCDNAKREEAIKQQASTSTNTKTGKGD